MPQQEVEDNSDEVEEIKEDRGYSDYFIATNKMVAHIASLLYTGYIIYVSQPGSSLFSWHPTLMAVAFSLMMSEAIIVFSPLSSPILTAKRPTKLMFHWIGMVAALISALAGLFAVWYNKELNGKPHMVSWHGTFGFATVAYVCVQCIAGFFVKNHHLIKSWYPKLKDLKLAHATSGLVLYTLVCGTLVMGMYSNFFVQAVTGTSWYFCLACPATLSLVVMTQITTAYMPVARGQR